jgi:hypothetical protein
LVEELFGFIVVAGKESGAASFLNKLLVHAYLLLGISNAFSQLRAIILKISRFFVLLGQTFELSSIVGSDANTKSWHFAPLVKVVFKRLRIAQLPCLK